MLKKQDPKNTIENKFKDQKRVYCWNVDNLKELLLKYKITPQFFI
jgi:hypothetical protein